MLLICLKTQILVQDDTLTFEFSLDSSYLFDNYLESVQRYKKNQAVFQPSRDSRPSPLLVDLLAKERVGVVPTLGMENMARAKAEKETRVDDRQMAKAASAA